MTPDGVDGVELCGTFDFVAAGHLTAIRKLQAHQLILDIQISSRWTFHESYHKVACVGGSRRRETGIYIKGGLAQRAAPVVHPSLGSSSKPYHRAS